MATSNHKINIWINLHFERWNFEHWSFKCEMIVIALEWGLGHDINLGLNQLIWDLDQVQVQLEAFQAFSNKPCSINGVLENSTPLKLLTPILLPAWQPNGMTQSFLFCLELDINGMLSIIGTKCIHCLQFQSMVQLKYLIKRQKMVEAPQEQNQCWEFSIVGLLRISLTLLTFPWTCSSSPFQHLDKGYALIPHSFTEFY